MSNSPEPQTPTRGAFQRVEGFDMQVGRVLGYQLTSTGMTIVAHRFGVAFRGTIPVVQREGMESLMGVFRRALVHHEHLKSSWDSGRQSYLTEDQVTLMLSNKPTPMSKVLSFDYGGDVSGQRITDNG